MEICAYRMCGTPVPQRATGRPAKFCGDPCRQAAYRDRKNAARMAAEEPVAWSSSIREQARLVERQAERPAQWVDVETQAEVRAMLVEARWLMLAAAEKLTPTALPMGGEAA